MWKDMGAKRVVLAREISLENIKEIREKVPDIELEVFVHGAMCMAISGRCLLSNYMTGREMCIRDSPTADPDGEEVVDRVLQNVTYSNGLVSGSKMGNSEGGLLVDWRDGNRAPEFPQSARASGKHGKLKIKLKVDKAGNVLSYVIVEGSGVPEIDASVERVVGSWRVKLLKKGKPVNGTFYLNYNFNFK